MKDQPPDWHRLDPAGTLSAQELSQCCHLRPDELDELVSYGALTAIESSSPARTFSGEWVGPLRSAVKLRADFDLDLFTVAVVLGYLRRIEALERELQHLRAQLPAPGARTHHEPGRWREGHGSAGETTT